ncbi:apolipoprotein N-acyltransferase [Marinicella sp. W31]|uniref:apolipoprotein N-acyltransferase n=1 Tax=Marinicella sp. W31 TaxID=3023713 RepID=UPI003757F733
MNTAQSATSSKNSINHEVYLFITVVLSSSILYFYGTGLQAFFVFTWLAPIPILWYLTFSRSYLPLIAGFLSYLLGSLNMFSYLLTHLPYILVIGNILIQALVFTCGLWLFSWGIQKNKLLGVFIFPCFWVSFEYIQSYLSQHGTFGSLAYTQADFEAFIQLASYTGIWGITFCLIFIPTLFVMAIKDFKTFLIPLALSFLLISIPILNRVDLAKEDTSALNVGLIASDPLIEFFNQTEKNAALTVLTQYFQKAEELIEEGLDILVLPEKIFTITEENQKPIKQLIQKFTSKNQLVLVVGLTLEMNDHKKNVAWVFDEENFIGEYTKQQLVPGWESEYIAGNENFIFSKWDKQIGVAICKDMDFPDLIRGYSHQGLDLILVPAWDFGKDAQLHHNMAKIRAIEGGFSMVRSASQGLLTTNNALGQSNVSISSNTNPITSIKSQIKLINLETVYSYMGDWFALLVMVVLLSLVFIIKYKS